VSKRGQIRIAAGLVLHTSNRLEILVDELAEVLAAPLASPFTPEIVVVQSHGMRRWLEQQIAQRHGICSNIQFPFPQDFFHGLFQTAFPQAERTNYFDRDVMTWRIMEFLPHLVARREFASVGRYLQGDRAELRAYELARRIAHVFDQYLVFRPKMILDWDAGREDDWQPILWRELQRAAPAQHQAALGSRLADALDKGAPVPERVSVFGISTLPPFYVSLFEQIAERCPVHLFLMEPTHHWFGNIRSKREKLRQGELDFGDESETDNALLAINARLSRDFLNIIADLNPREFRERFDPPAGETFLRTIQRDIYDLESAPPQQREIGDYSLQIHSCHSVTRELEVLHDQLLALFENDPALKPRDIVVMMPDVSVYAPFVDAVFGVPENHAHAIPFAVADRSPRARSGVIDTFVRVLEILPGRFGSSEVLAILESSALQRRFEIGPSDTAFLHRWIAQCGIRWGVDAAHRERLGFPAFAENSWRHGLDRMLLGYAMQPQGRELFAEILPFDEIEGSNAVLLGNFVELLEQLFALASDFAQPRPLADWQRDLLTVIDRFLDPDEDGQLELYQLRTALNQLGAIGAALENNGAISLEVVAAHLERSLDQTRTGAGFLSGKMTFCALKPMRSIPFKVVCLLGLNDTAYPRRDRAPSFDLVAAKPQRGDRNMRDDDRALFLEAMLSARDVWYLSYIGQSARDNSELPPSVLIGELLDYIDENFQIARDEFVVKHPLQAFSPRNFGAGDWCCFSYSAENSGAGEIAESGRHDPLPFLDQALREPAPEWRDVEITRLVEFLAHPAKFFVRQRLGIELPREEEIKVDREPFALHALDRYAIERELLPDALAGGNLESAAAAIRARGILPAAGAGALAFDELCRSARDFAQVVRTEIEGEAEPPRAIREEIGDFVLKGTLAEIHGETLVHFRLAKLKPKDFLNAWIQHLARNLREQKPSRLFGMEKGAVAGYEFLPLPDACEMLQEILALYWRGLHEPLRLFPRTSWKFVEKIAAGRTPKEARYSVRNEWSGKDEDGRGEMNDVFIKLAFRDIDDQLDTQWEETSCKILLPILKARRRL
jgi:exodeoxyribonuclease V gamma subunit